MIRIYRSAVNGITGILGHVYIYSSEKKEGIGSDFFGQGNEHGVGKLNNPYYKLDIGNRSESRFFNKVKSYPEWSIGEIRPGNVYIPWYYDCYVELEGSLEYAGVPHKIKHKRVDFSKAFVGPSQSRDIKQSVDRYFKEINNDAEQKKQQIANIIINTAKTNHKYKDKTGRLTSSIVYRNDTIYSTSKYVGNVVNKTKDDFIVNALKTNQSKIESIITRVPTINDSEIKESVTKYGHEMLTEQFNGIM